jgi:hypothetical protein
LTAPAKVLELEQAEEPPESDRGALSGVIQRAPPQPVDHQEACDESALAEALTLAARAGRWDVVAYLAALRGSKP